MIRERKSFLSRIFMYIGTESPYTVEYHGVTFDMRIQVIARVVARDARIRRGLRRDRLLKNQARTYR